MEPLFPLWIMLAMIPLMIWETIWKGIGLWKAARHEQTAWYICILLLNTLGILPIIYILFFQKKNKKK